MHGENKDPMTNIAQALFGELIELGVVRPQDDEFHTDNVSDEERDTPPGDPVAEGAIRGWRKATSRGCRANRAYLP
jgi:hypothetical protein